MSGMLAGQLAEWLAEGRNLIGEVRIERTQAGFALCHYLDSPDGTLTVHSKPENAVDLGKYDSGGRYRPLRSAPTLKRGWQLNLSAIEEVVQALDYFYPAMLGTARVFEQKLGCPVTLRETLQRQTGMYRVTQNISNADADTLIGQVCAPGNCLKTVTWRIEGDYPIQSLPDGKTNLLHDQLQQGGFIPLPCEECCNILVAAVRETVKKATPPSPTNPI